MKTTKQIQEWLYLIRGTIRKEFLLYTRYPIELISSVVTPLLMLMPIIMLGKIYLADRTGSGFSEFTGTNNFGLYVVMGSLFLQFVENLFLDIISFIKKEMWMGTLEQLWLSPGSKLIILFTRSLFSSLKYMIFSTITLLIAYLIFNFDLRLSLAPILLSTILFFLTLVAMQGFSLIFAGMVLVWKIDTVPTILNSIMYVLAGAMYPITALPRFAQLGSIILPQTYALDLLRFNIMKSQTIFPVIQEIFILAGATVLFPILGLFVFFYLDRRNRISGSLDHY